MRTVSDRVRHAIGFEMIGLILCMPLASRVLEQDVWHLGLLGLALSLLGTFWNYVFNLLFDRLLLAWRGRLHKTFVERIGHALAFEFGLLLFTLPAISSYLSISLLQAFWVDMGFVLFYVVYALGYNWGYDKVFPLPILQGD